MTPLDRVTQCQDLFDCLPAVRAAFLFTKVFFNSEVCKVEEVESLEIEPNENIEEDITNSTVEEKNSLETTSKVEEKLEFHEFRMFLQALRLYFLYCQVIKY